MYKIFFIGLFLSLSVFSYSQMPAASVYGKVIDSATGKGIDAASVQITQTKLDTTTKKPVEVVVNGMLTGSSGEFRIENIPLMGQYKIIITGIGYRTYTTKLSFFNPATMKKGGQDMTSMLGALDKDLGNIKLGIDQQVLTGVVVTGTRPLVQLGIDRKIYNVEGNLASAGGTAVDVMKNIPSVNVDIDGNITVRNSLPQIFVDGRPTTLTLDQIPADQIETIEVITNPSAKYDASGGTAGILNIVLKKQKRVGYSGNLRAGIDQRGKLNFGGNVNLRQGKFNIFANAFLGQRKSISYGDIERSTFIGGDTTILLQKDKNINNGNFFFTRAGFDYFLDNRNTITVSGLAMRGKFTGENFSNILTRNINDATNTESATIRNTNSDGTFKNTGGSLAYVHNFPKSGHQLTADANYNKSHNNSTNTISNEYYMPATGPLTGTYNQFQTGIGDNERITVQTDYTNPITDKMKLESGLRLNQSTMNSESNMSQLLSNGSLLAIPAQSSKFKYTDRVLAGYVNFSSKIGENFGYQVGLRLESSNYKGTVHNYVQDASATTYRDSVSTFSIQYPVSLFPSIFLSQKLPNDQELQLNYSRRINRPNFFQLYPFVDYSDSLNLSRGNPNLKPEFVNSFELSYSKNFDKSNTLLLSAYYKLTNDLIARYQLQENNPLTNTPVLINTYINANSSYVGGFEAISKNTITKWWDITSNLNIYSSKIKIDTIATADQIYSWFAKINNNIKLPKNFTLQLSGDYNSKTVLAPGGSSSNSGGGRGMGGFGTVSGNAQGYSMPSYGVDAALKYEFLKSKAASITLSVNDIFKTRVSDMYTYSDVNTQHTVRNRDQQFFRLNFSYRFGKFDASLFKRKNLKSEQESIQGGMEGSAQ